jgi:Protein of unknown function (DUF1499)
MGLIQWFSQNWCDTDESGRGDPSPLELPVSPDEGLRRLTAAFRSGAARGWKLLTVNGVSESDAPTNALPPERVRQHLTRWLGTGELRHPAWLTLTRTTAILRFVDDVIVRLEPASTGCRLHAYSRSRVGAGDLGQTRRNVLALMRISQSLFDSPSQGKSRIGQE